MKTLVSQSYCSLYFKVEVPSYTEFCHIYRINPGTKIQSTLPVDTLMMELFKLPKTDVKDAYIFLTLGIIDHYFKVQSPLTYLKEHCKRLSTVHIQFIPPVPGRFIIEGPEITMEQFEKAVEGSTEDYFSRFISLFKYSKNECCFI